MTLAREPAISDSRSAETSPAASGRDESRDLGFGAVVSRESRRLLNRDGSFNVRREGLPFWGSQSLYQDLLTMSWPRFLSLVTAVYLITNIAFALAYLACGPGALAGPGNQETGRFSQAFFFSIHTLATIGYGNVSPASLAANLLVTLESLLGLLGVALIAGIAFSRFARPTALIVFSDVALIAPYRGGTAFEFRIANGRNNQLVELEAVVVLARRDSGDDTGIREFTPLTLERARVAFFPLSWTVVHPIDETSPLHGVSEAELRESGAEFLVLLAGVDETFAQTVHSRTSYLADEVVFGARFKDMFARKPNDGSLMVDVRLISDHQRL